MKANRNGRRSAWLAVLLVATSGLVLLVAHVNGQGEGGEKAKPKVREVLRQSLREKLDGQPARVTLVEVEYPPGGSSTPHRHPGPVVGYVLQGAIAFQIDDGPLRTYRQGETFYEPARALHKVSRNASQTEPARFLAYLLTGEDEEQLVLPPD